MRQEATISLEGELALIGVLLLGLIGACRSDKTTVITAELRVDRTNFVLGEPIRVRMVIHNNSTAPIEIGDALYPVDYHATITDDPVSESVGPLLGSPLAGSGPLPPKPKARVSECSVPLIEIYGRSPVLHADFTRLVGRTVIAPGHSWQKEVDIGPVLSAPGEYVILGTLNQGPVEGKSCVRGLTTSPVVLEVRDNRDRPSRTDTYFGGPRKR